MVHVQVSTNHHRKVLSEALREEPFTLVLSAGFFGFFAHVKDDLDATSHFLVRLRIFHPVIAVVFTVAVILIGLNVFDEAQGQNLFVAKLGKALMHCTLLEVVVGGTTIILGAPGYMQLIHLFFAQILWTLWALIFFSTWRKKETLIY